MNIAAICLHNQQIARTRCDKPEQAVAWLGGWSGRGNAAS